MLDLLGWFLPTFFKGLAVNFQLAFWVLLGGLPIGAVLAYLRLGTGWVARLTGWFVAVLRAVPTFVVMFFLVNVLPGDFSVVSMSVTMSPKVAIVLALIIYMTVVGAVVWLGNRWMSRMQRSAELRTGAAHA